VAAGKSPLRLNPTPRPRLDAPSRALRLKGALLSADPDTHHTSDGASDLSRRSEAKANLGA